LYIAVKPQIRPSYTEKFGPGEAVAAQSARRAKEA
jgi:hypothetical protein